MVSWYSAVFLLSRCDYHILDVFILSSIRLIEHQLDTLSSSCWRAWVSSMHLIGRYSTVSSAKRAHVEATQEGMSVMKRLKKKGPMTLHWCTPADTRPYSEKAPLYRTLCSRPHRNDLAQNQRSPQMLYWSESLCRTSCTRHFVKCAREIKKKHIHWTRTRSFKTTKP